MIAHTTLPVSDYAKSKAFYVHSLAPFGYTNNMEAGEAAPRPCGLLGRGPILAHEGERALARTKAKFERRRPTRE